MTSGAYGKVSGTVFAAVAGVHAVRAFEALPLTVGTTSVPIWISWVAAVVAALLSIWGFRSGGRAG